MGLLGQVQLQLAVLINKRACGSEIPRVLGVVGASSVLSYCNAAGRVEALKNYGYLAVAAGTLRVT